MGLYNYEYFISDFAKRTMENYKLISENPNSRYEVTQLINSLFGLLIVPNEKYKYRKNGQGLKENMLKKTTEYNSILQTINTLKNTQKLYNNYNEAHEVSAFIKHLRNSLAHSGNEGIHFLPCEEGQEITSIIFYDTDKDMIQNGTNYHEFCVELQIEEIEKLAIDISSMYSRINDSIDSAEENKQMYVNDILKYRELLKKS